MPVAEVGRLVAVSVGMPHDVAWRGRTVHTGVWKQPVPGPHVVRELNIDGDGQGDLAGHGGPHRAVLVYQLGSYEHWREHLHRDDLEAGAFGENFTVEGLADDEVCIGDRLEIGGALFEVSQPRVTCYRVGLRLDEPRLPALLVAHRRPGFYLRVLRPGVVEAGDAIVREHASADRMTVAEIDGLLYLPGHDRREAERALRIEALSPGWRGSFQAIVDADGVDTGNAGLVPVAAEPSWSGFRPLRVVEVTNESSTVVSLHLAAPDEAPLPMAEPGQFVTLRVRPTGERRPTARSFSLSGPPGAPAYRVSIRRDPHGLVSRFVHSTMRVGSVVDTAAPRGSFVLEPGTAPVLLVSAGIGATPLVAMLYALVAAGSTREVWWLHGARNGAEHAFAGEVRSELAKLPGARRVTCYSQPLTTDVLGRDYTHAGRLGGELLAGLGLPPQAQAYLCGPPGFLVDVRAALARAGLPDDALHAEIFGSGPAQTPGIADQPLPPPHPPVSGTPIGPDVTFSRSGLTVPWTSGATSLLELAEACDVPTRWSCRTGVCHTCQTGLLSGRVSHDPQPVDPPAPGTVLVCCSTPTEDVVLDL